MASAHSAGGDEEDKLAQVVSLYEARLADSKQLVEAQRQQLEELRSQVVAATKDRDSAIQALHKSNSARMSLSEDKKALEAELVALKETLDGNMSGETELAKISKDLESERQLVKRLKDRIQSLVNEKKELRAELQKAELEADAKDSVSRKELDSVKEKSKDFLRKAMDAKKSLEQRVSQLENQIEVGEALAEQLQNENMQLRLSKPSLSSAAAAGAGGDELEATRRALTKAEEELARYKARAAVILRQRRPAVVGGQRSDSALQAGSQDEADAVATDSSGLASYEEAQAAARHLQADVMRLRGELEATEASRLGLQKEVDRLQELVSDGEAQRALLSADSAELRRQLDAQRGAMVQAQAGVRKAIQDEVHHLQSDIAGKEVHVSISGVSISGPAFAAPCPCVR